MTRSMYEEGLDNRGRIFPQIIAALNFDLFSSSEFKVFCRPKFCASPHSFPAAVHTFMTLSCVRLKVANALLKCSSCATKNSSCRQVLPQSSYHNSLVVSEMRQYRW